MSQDTSYDHPGSHESLGRRRRRGLTNREERTPYIQTTFHTPHGELHEVNHHPPVSVNQRESILD